MKSSVEIRDMQVEDERFVGSCTHVCETEEWDASCQRRIPWLRDQCEKGLRIKVAIVEGGHAGFLYLMPIEMAPAGPIGQGLSVIQCLTVKEEVQNRGVGQALVAAAEEEARRQGRKGVVVTGFYHDFWFMPAPFFEKCGFTVAKRNGNVAILWKVIDDSAETPSFLERRYQFTPVEGKVVVDLFWSRSCLTTDTEAQRVREVAAEFGDSVELHEYCSDNLAIRSQYQIYRAIFIDGKEVGWGYEAPRDGLRKAIREAMGGD